MNSKILLTMMLTAMVPFWAQAETVILKNGSAVEGKIIEKDGRKVKLEVNGVPMTYYLDEIEVIDGVAPTMAVTPSPEPSAPAPAVSNNLVVPAAAPVVVPAGPVSKPALSGLPKKDLILKFVDVFGTRTSLTQNFDQLIKSAPPAQANEIRKAVNVDEIIEGLVPIYDKYFTQEELQAYIDFYSSPAGRKLVETIPHVMTDSVGVSLKYFKAKLPSIPAEEMK